MKIGIVGMGWVGSSVAASVLHTGVARQLLVSDLDADLAEGECMDLAHGAAFLPTSDVRAVAVEEMRDADAVVVAAGRGGKGRSRLSLLRDNAAIMRSIASSLRGLKGLLIVVSNPVDVMTHVALEASGLPPERVLGTGTTLDTARLRQVLGRELGLEPRSVHAQVIGEHGDSEVVLWSGARVGGLPLARWPGWDPGRQDAVTHEVRVAAYEIIRRKGATNHAIGLVTASLLRGALRGERRVLTVSRVQEGVAGIDGVCLSLPSVVGAEGAVTVVEPEMSDEERAALHRSADVLRAAKESLESG